MQSSTWLPTPFQHFLYICVCVYWQPTPQRLLKSWLPFPFLSGGEIKKWSMSCWRLFEWLMSCWDCSAFSYQTLGLLRCVWIVDPDKDEVKIPRWWEVCSPFNCRIPHHDDWSPFSFSFFFLFSFFFRNHQMNSNNNNNQREERLLARIFQINKNAASRVSPLPLPRYSTYSTSSVLLF